MACNNCPITELIPDQGSQACGLTWRQTSGLMFMEPGNYWTDDTVPATDIQALAAWTTREAAADTTKIQVLQNVSSFIVPTNESINIAADTNDTPEGKQINVDSTSQVVTFVIRDIPVAMVTALQTLSCSTQLSGQIGVVLLSSDSVMGKLATPDEFDSLPISSMWVSDIGLGGKTDTNNININFTMDPDWYVDSVVKSVDFNPLTFQNT